MTVTTNLTGVKHSKKTVAGIIAEYLTTDISSISGETFAGRGKKFECNFSDNTKAMRKMLYDETVEKVNSILAEAVSRNSL